MGSSPTLKTVTILTELKIKAGTLEAIARAEAEEALPGSALQVILVLIDQYAGMVYDNTRSMLLELTNILEKMK